MKIDSHRRHWQYIRPWFRPIWLKLLIPWFAIIPIAIALIKDVPESITLGPSRSIEIAFSLPFRWWLLWWASFLYFVAFGIYQWRCPLLVRRYANYSDYEAWGHSPRWISWELKSADITAVDDGARQKLFKRLVEKKLAQRCLVQLGTSQADPTVTEQGTIYQFKYQDVWYEYIASEKKDNARAIEREVFWEVYARFASGRPRSRLVVWLLLFAAAVFLVVAVLQNIWTALAFLFANCADAIREWGAV